MLADDPTHAGPAPVIAKELSNLIEGEAQVHVLLTATEADAPLPGSVAEKVFRQALPANEDAMDAFLELWRPDFGLVIGRPETAAKLKKAVGRGVPMFHVSVNRQSGAHRYPAYLKQFHTCLAASATEGEALRKFLSDSEAGVVISGPLTDTVHALGCNEAECDELAKLLGGRPVWLAVSVNSDEVAMVEAAHRKAFRSAHRLLLVLVPKSPDDAPGIVSALETNGWRVGLRSRGDEPDPDVQVYVADTEGELGLWYRLAPSTFIGGTFVPSSPPAEPFDPAALGSAVLHGPHTGNCPGRFQRLDAQGASILVMDANELGEAVITLLSPDKAASLAQAGWAATTESAHVVERLAELMHGVLEARKERA